MKNREIFKFRENLDTVDYIKNKTFAFAVFKNKQILDLEIEAINSIKKLPGDDFSKFEEERTKLCTLHAEKDDNGNPILEYGKNGQQSFKIENLELFSKEYEPLTKKYETVLSEIEVNNAEFEEFLNKESDIVLKTVSIDSLPDDINSAFLESIQYMLS